METAPDTMDALKAALWEVIVPRCPPDRDGAGAAATPASAARTGSAPPRVVGEGLTGRQWRHIGRDTLALHEGYTRGTAAFAHEDNPIHQRLAAYQLYFLPRNVFRVGRVLRELPWGPPEAPPPGWLSSGSGGAPTLRLLDLGAGTGAFSLAWLAWLAEQPWMRQTAVHLQLTLVDQGHELLAVAVANLQAFAARILPEAPLDIDTHADGVQAYLGAASGDARHAVVGAAMTLNELGLLGSRRVSARGEQLAERMRRRVRDQGCLMLVEPGTRKGYMNLMALRPHLMSFPVLYPCPHTGECPLWDNRVSRWCHATTLLPKGFFFDDLLKRRGKLEFDMRELHLAGLAVQVGAALQSGQGGGPSQPGPPFIARAGERMLSAPMRPRRQGRRRRPGGDGAAPSIILTCGGDGRLHERPAAGLAPATRGDWLERPPR